MTASSSISNSDSALSRSNYTLSFRHCDKATGVAKQRERLQKSPNADISAVAPTPSVTFGSRGGNWQSLGGKRQ